MTNHQRSRYWADMSGFCVEEKIKYRQLYRHRLLPTVGFVRFSTFGDTQAHVDQ
jgi:hypothetical protein